MLAPTPKEPYWAVIFTSLRDEQPADGYPQTAEQMEALARQQPGFLGVESARTPGGLSITVSYWASSEAIAAWRQQADHLSAQRAGREKWYRTYAVRVAKVERTSTFP